MSWFFPLEDLKRTHLTNWQRLGTFTDTVFQRRTKLLEADLETITGPGFHAIGERQCGGAEVMHMNIAGAQKLCVLEEMEFQVGEAVAHVVFAAEKRLFPERFAIAGDAADAGQMRAIINQVFHNARVDIPSGIVETTSIMTLLSLIQQTDMLGVTPVSVVEDYPGRDLLAVLPIKFEARLPPYGLITRRHRIQSSAMQAFMNLVRAEHVLSK